MKTNVSKEYKKAVDSLNFVVRDCINLSNRCAGIPAKTNQHYFASLLFTQICTRSVSLMILVPHSPWAKKKLGSQSFEPWDFSSIAGLSRSILETRLAFFYMCIEQCSDDELNCRWNLFNLHDCKSRMRLFRYLPDNEKDLDGFAIQVQELRDQLQKNDFFITLKHQKNLLDGKTAYIYELNDIAVRAGIDLQDYFLLHKLFSSHIHCAPMSFYRMGERDSGRGIHNECEEGYTLICLSFIKEILVAAQNEMKALFELK